MKDPKLPFQEGDPFILLDRKQRVYYGVLQAGKQTNIRGDILPHDTIIGRTEAFLLRSQRKIPFWVFRPTFNDHVVNMPRGATVIYPKDLGIILQYADVYPGAKVVEAGHGSGALATALLRAVGPSGQVISYDIRQDFINNARKNLHNFFGAAPNHTVREINIYESFVDTAVDRLILDLPEPWQVVPLAVPHLRPGAMICSYSPTVIQVKSFCEALRQARCFIDVLTLETLLRRWNIDGLSVRPELRMIGHTGFLTFARKVEPPPHSAADTLETEVAEESSEEDRERDESFES